jgi:serine/threonine protein kinase
MSLSRSKYIGPPEDPKRYKIITRVGSESVYGQVYKSERVSDGKLFAVKIMIEDENAEKYWLNEVNCLIDVMKICKDVDILCFEDAFIYKNKDGSEYIIITPFLNDYITLNKFLKSNYSLSLEAGMKIYKSLVDVKNAMTESCGLSHADLHNDNVMIDPKTMDVKVIDLGLCKTPREEKIYYGFASDVIKLSKLLDILIEKVNKKIKEDFESITIKSPPSNCIRNRSVWKTRNSEEFEKQVNYFIDKIEKNTNNDEINELFKNLFDFIEANGSMMTDKSKQDIIKELDKKKKRITNLVKYKKILGKDDKEEIEHESSPRSKSQESSPRSKSQESSPKIVSDKNEWDVEVKRLIDNLVQEKGKKDKIKKAIKLFEFILNNNPDYLSNDLLDILLKKSKEFSIQDEIFKYFMYDIERIKEKRLTSRRSSPRQRSHESDDLSPRQRSHESDDLSPKSGNKKSKQERRERYST